MGDITLFGTTLARPFKLAGRSDVEVTGGVLTVKESIESIILTDAANPSTGVGGERVYNRSVGINIIRYLFRTDSPLSRNGLRNELMKITHFEPRIILRKSGIQVIKSDLNYNIWIVRLTYQLVQTGETRNHVIPLFARDRYIEILPEGSLAA